MATEKHTDATLRNDEYLRVNILSFLALDKGRKAVDYTMCYVDHRRYKVIEKFSALSRDDIKLN